MKKFLLLIIMISAALPAWAEDKTIFLDEVVVTATRTDEEIDQIPANVTVITQEDIKKSTAITVQDLLRNEEGLNIIDLYGSGTKSTVDMRGFARGLNTQVMVDGRKVNKIDLSGVDWNLIPLENVERIEVVRGTGSVLYGDNAMAGVINIITKKGLANKPEFEADGRIESYSGHAEFATLRGGNEKFGYFFFAKHRDTDGYRQNSGFNTNDLSTRLTFTPNEIFSVDFAAGYHVDQQGLPGALTEQQLEADRRQSATPNDQTDFNERYFDIKPNIPLGKWGDLELGYSFDNRKSDALYVSFGDFRIKNDTDTGSYKIKLTADTQIADRKNLIVTGLDFYDADAENSTFSSFGNSFTELSKEEFGVYFHDEYFVSDKLSLTAGYRHSNTTYQYTTNDFFGKVSGEKTYRNDAVKVGITYNYADRSKLYVSYAKGYRLPTTEELINFDGTVALLKPEKSDTYEAGISHLFGDRLLARLTVYTMNIRDELLVNPFIDFTANNANQNIDKTRHSGAEAGLTAYLTDAFSVNGNFTYTEAKLRSEPYLGKTIPQVPRYSGNIGADVFFTKSFLLAVKANWVGSRYLLNDLKNAFDKQESYITLNAKLSYTYKRMTAYIGLNNILNEKYSEYAAVNQITKVTKFGPSPELNYYAGLRFTF